MTSKPVPELVNKGTAKMTWIYYYIFFTVQLRKMLFYMKFSRNKLRANLNTAGQLEV